jgi:choline dehydrogenase-like flavoprotein
MTSEKQEFDAIVVGTGPGGATISKELTQAGKKVLILEWGNNDPVKGTAIQGASQLMMPGKSLLLTNGMMTVTRGITTGGSSLFFCATAFEPPVDLFKSYGIDISREIDEVKAEVPVKVLKDDLVGPMAKRMMDSAQDLGYGWEKLTKFIIQEKCRPNCSKCTWGCPQGAKWNGRMFVEDAVKSGATLINNAKVKSVIRQNAKAVGVLYSKNGMTQDVHAPLVILSAGGIGTPQILRESGISQAGYDFFYDPLFVVKGVVKDTLGGNEIPMAAGIHMEDEGYLMTDMAMPKILNTLSAAQALKFQNIFAHPNTLQIMIKIKDELGGSLTDGGGVRKGLSQEDQRKFTMGYNRAKAILKNAGAKDIHKGWYMAAHPGGTAKIDDVVDRDLMTEIENLYVCDCSVVPEAWGLPPTFSLICLAKRLARHLGNK